MPTIFSYVLGRPSNLQTIEVIDEEVLEEAPVVDPLADVLTDTSGEEPVDL
jgi:hypothetical protein